MRARCADEVLEQAVARTSCGSNKLWLELVRVMALLARRQICVIGVMSVILRIYKLLQPWHGLHSSTTPGPCEARHVSPYICIYEGGVKSGHTSQFVRCFYGILRGLEQIRKVE